MYVGIRTMSGAGAGGAAAGGAAAGGAGAERAVSEFSDMSEGPDGAGHGRPATCKHGKVRNWLTGYCHTPCEDGHPRHPTTGVCLTQEEFDAEGFGDDDYFTYTPQEHSQRSVNRPFDNFVAEPTCPEGKMLNTTTAKCAVPKACKAWQVINPRTRRCVTREYLKRQDPSPTLYPDENDDTVADWTPTLGDSIDKHIQANTPLRLVYQQQAVEPGFGGIWELTLADMRTMCAVHVVNEQEPAAFTTVGIYSPPQRKYCEGSTFTQLFVNNFYACGFRQVQRIPQPGEHDDPQPYIAELAGCIEKRNNPNQQWGEQWVLIEDIVFRYHLMYLLCNDPRMPEQGRYLYIAKVGVFRIVVAAKLDDNPVARAQIEDLFDNHYVGNTDDVGANKELATALDDFAVGRIQVNFHAYHDASLQDPYPGYPPDEANL